MVRPRAFAFALAFLVVIDLVLRSGVSLPVPHDFRMPDRTTMGYEQFVKNMARSDDVRVGVVGDSVIWGTYAEPGDTLPPRMAEAYARADIPARVGNFGTNGAHTSDFLPLVADLAEEDAVDVIFLNLDYRFLLEEPVVRRYPEIWTSVEDWNGVPRDLATPPGADATPTVQQRADDAIGRGWRLFALRDYAAATVLGDVPADSITRSAHRYRAARYGPPLYGKKPASKLPHAELRKGFSVPPLTEQSTYIRYLGAVLDIAEREGIPVVVFAGPLDTTLLTDLQLWTPASYHANLDFIGRYSTSRGAVFLDYTYALPAELLGDSHHPLGPGYAALAEKIVGDTTGLVRGVARARSDELNDVGGDRP